MKDTSCMDDEESNVMYSVTTLDDAECASEYWIIVKLREREGQGVDPGRSLKGHLWMVDGGWWYPFPDALH